MTTCPVYPAGFVTSDLEESRERPGCLNATGFLETLYCDALRIWDSNTRTIWGSLPMMAKPVINFLLWPIRFPPIRLLWWLIKAGVKAAGGVKADATPVSAEGGPSTWVESMKLDAKTGLDPAHANGFRVRATPYADTSALSAINYVWDPFLRAMKQERVYVVSAHYCLQARLPRAPHDHLLPAAACMLAAGAGPCCPVLCMPPRPRLRSTSTRSAGGACN